MLLVANWKAYVEELSKAKSLVALGRRLMRDRTLRIVIAPPATFVGALAVRNRSDLQFAAQDVSATTGGAKTGEVTARTYATVGVTYAIVGHSERRALGDTNAVVTEKVSHAVAHDLIPIVCVGESERDSEGRYLAVVREQILTAFSPLTPKERKKVIVAYEPVWAIGKDASHAIKPNDLTEMVLYIRKVLAGLLPGKTKVLYGGSVESDDAYALAAHSGIDGFLVGHASVDPVTFTALVKALP